ncbi:MAG: 3-deoxy-8-phosphooctulonate synthase [Eudoraea sp.]|nr:3-deoxy-8-phosphooctulonate synthase [Eudoraea sp.]
MKDSIRERLDKRPESFLLLAGPCVVENEEIVRQVATEAKNVAGKYNIPLVLKGSYRKANRSRLDSFSGIGDIEALEVLSRVASEFGLNTVTDIHAAEEAEMAANYVDILQIPAFLCRQTDLLLAAGKTGKWVNIKKGQFLSGESMNYAVEKVKSTGNNNIMLTERGSMFGYGDLVVDMRNIPVMKKTGVPVIVDITHSLQQPNSVSGVTGGRPEMIDTIAMAAMAAGADGIFLETHPDPSKALSDGANMLELSKLDKLIYKLTELRKTVININK